MQTVSSRTLRTVVSPIAFGLLMLLAWEAVCRGLQVSKFVIPRPSEIVPMFVLRWHVLWPNALQTLTTTLIGLAIGVAIGFALGVALGASSRPLQDHLPHTDRHHQHPEGGAGPADGAVGRARRHPGDGDLGGDRDLSDRGRGLGQHRHHGSRAE
jgi:hypothetical protein